MMKILVLLLLVSGASAQINCEVARTLKEGRLDGFNGVSLANWVCLAFAESGYDHLAERIKPDGSTGYGIFQINNRFWCYNGRFPGKKGCPLPCMRLLSVQNSIFCAMIIVEEQGMTAWKGWVDKCQNRDVSQYIAGCGV